MPETSPNAEKAGWPAELNQTAAERVRSTRRRAKIICIVGSAVFVLACLGLMSEPSVVGTVVRGLAGYVLSPGVWAVLLPTSLMGMRPLKHAALLVGMGSAIDTVLYAAVLYAIWRWILIHDWEERGKR